MSGSGELAGRTVIVTGGGSGNGRAIACGVAERGGHVVVIDNSEVGAATTVAQLSPRGTGEARKLDVRDVDAVQSAIHEYDDLWGLVNNAGVLSRHPFLSMPIEDFDDVVSVNLRGYFICAQAAARVMAKRGGGSIVQIASNTARMARAGLAHYVASKGGILSMTRTMAVELAPMGIRVNTISPGVIRTEMNRDRLDIPEARAELIAGIPAGRLGRPTDLVGAAMFLLTDESGFVTGADLVIDGGELAS